MRVRCRPAERAVIMSSCHDDTLVMTSVSWWGALMSGTRYSLPASDPTVRGMPIVQSLRPQTKLADRLYCEKKSKRKFHWILWLQEGNECEQKSFI